VSRTSRSIVVVPALVTVLGAAPGCITLKKHHDALASRVSALETQTTERDQRLEETLTRADEQMDELESRLKDAEKILRSNQASLGIQVQDMQGEVAQTRGLAEDSQNEVAALGQNVEEMRGDLDRRLATLESKLNEATNIPEGKTALLREGQKQLKAKNYKYARRLFRTYLSRYPGDAKEAEARFNIGLTLYSERDYRSSLGEFYWIVQNAPESEMINDSLYYSGLAFAKLGQCQKAIAYFGAIAKEGSTAPDRYKKQATKQISLLEKDDGSICSDTPPAGEAQPAKPKAPAKKN
jgi:TolA-binding protein